MKHQTKESDQPYLSPYSIRNPNPIITLSACGETIYANAAAKTNVETGDTEGSDGLIPKKIVDTAVFAFANNEELVEIFQLKNQQYSFTFCPDIETNLVHLFATDVTKEVKYQEYCSVISAFSSALLDAHTEEEVAKTIASEAIARLSYVDCVVYLVDRKDHKLKQRAAHGPQNPKTPAGGTTGPSNLRFGEGIVGAAAMEKKTLIIDDVTKDARYVVDDAQRYSEIAVPIIAEGEVIGVIDSEHPEKDFFTKEDAKVLEAIAAISATSIRRSRAMEDSAHTEAKFRSFVDNAFGGLYIHRNREFDYVNERFCEMVGYTAEELLEPDFDMASLIIEPDAAAADAMEARTNGDRSPKSYQLKVKTKNGELRYLAVNTAILSDKNGYFTLGIALDITETIQSRQQLEEVVQSLEKKSDELNEFAHLASHNMRAPVTNLIGLLNHFDYQNPAAPLNAEILEKFGDTVDQLNLTLEEMHQVLRVRAQKSFNYNTVNLQDLVDGIRLRLSKQIKASRFRVVTNFEVENVKYEKSHLENLFMNLISNALTYRRNDGTPYIQIQSSRSGDHIQLEFKDNGLGIDLEKHEKNLFGMYKRFHDNPEGRGVGLYLVKRQLSALGGTISVKSEPNVGSTFTVKLISK